VPQASSLKRKGKFEKLLEKIPKST